MTPQSGGGDVLCECVFVCEGGREERVREGRGRVDQLEGRRMEDGWRFM